MMEASLADRIVAIRARMDAAARRVGRPPHEIILIAVSKTHSAEAIRAAAQLGLTHFGENRVQEWEGKRGALQDLACRWHLIGHLQSNKANRAAHMFHSVDSVDDLALAQRLDRARKELSLSGKLRVLIEVRVAPEQTKSGVAPSKVSALVEQIAALPQLDLAGLMCIPPFLEQPEEVRPHFVQLRGLRDHAEIALGRKLPVLSMGMSHDFEVAIEEGATEIRVGTALFGSRVAVADS